VRRDEAINRKMLVHNADPFFSERILKQAPSVYVVFKRFSIAAIRSLEKWDFCPKENFIEVY
jgi:hypothetical protein